MPEDESVLIQAQRLLARALEVQQSCADFYAREAERKGQEGRAAPDGSEDGSLEEAQLSGAAEASSKQRQEVTRRRAALSMRPATTRSNSLEEQRSQAAQQ